MHVLVYCLCSCLFWIFFFFCVFVRVLKRLPLSVCMFTSSTIFFFLPSFSLSAAAFIIYAVVFFFPRIYFFFYPATHNFPLALRFLPFFYSFFSSFSFIFLPLIYSFLSLLFYSIHIASQTRHAFFIQSYYASSQAEVGRHCRSQH